MDKTLPTAACCALALLLGGCVNISSRITPENQAVKPMSEGSDCSYAIMSFGYGTNTVEQAMKNATPPILKVRSVSTDMLLLPIVSTFCLTVVGEPAPGYVTPVKPKGYDPTEQQP